MKKLAVALLMLVSSQAWGVAYTISKVPCMPLFVAGPQGRPLPDATVAIADTLGLAPANVWATPDGGQAYNYRIPPNQIIQFWMDDAGLYQVTVNASGMTKYYWTQCSYTLTTNRISIDRPAETFAGGTATFNAELTKPNFWAMVQLSYIFFDWIMPTYALNVEELLLSFRGHTIAGWHDCNADIQVNWCKYANGANQCAILAATNTGDKTVAMLGANKRVDLTFEPVTEWPAAAGSWPIDNHIIISVKLLDTSTCSGVILENARLEFSR